MVSEINNYKILKSIGAGSYGKVYKVQRLLDQKIYAMKKISLTQINSYYKNSILNEIKILSSHDSIHLIKYYDSFIDNNFIYIITDFASKGDLCSKINKYKNSPNSYFDDNLIWKYFISICMGAQYLHKSNIIHRDIKPANIFIDKNDNIKIGDFGISKILKSTNNYANTIIGTPYYISPEIWNKQKYNNKIDIWSIGCVLYEMIFLKLPFNGRSMEALSKIVRDSNVNILNLNINKDFIFLIKAMLNKDPFKRISLEEILNLTIVKNKIIELNIKIDINPLMNIFPNIDIPKYKSQWCKYLPESKYTIVEKGLPLINKYRHNFNRLNNYNSNAQQRVNDKQHVNPQQRVNHQQRVNPPQLIAQHRVNNYINKRINNNKLPKINSHITKKNNTIKYLKKRQICNKDINPINPEYKKYNIISNNQRNKNIQPRRWIP